MSRKNNPGTLAMGVSGLPSMYRDVNPNQAATIFLLVARSVADGAQAFIGRQDACRALSGIGTPDAAVSFVAQFPGEDQNLRERFERDLRKLEKKRSVVGTTQ